MGAAFSVRDACPSLVLRIAPYRVDSKLHVTVDPPGGGPRVYALAEPFLIVELVDLVIAGGADGSFNCASVPSEDGAGDDA